MKCTFEQNGFCRATQEFEGWQCPLKDGNDHCIAKPEQLTYCCPYQGEEDCTGVCSTCANKDDVTLVPKKEVTL